MVGKSNKSEIAARLSKALARGDANAFTAALMVIVRERGGMTLMAKQIGLSRHTLYRYEWGTDRLLLETALKITGACGYKLVVVPVQDT